MSLLYLNAGVYDDFFITTENIKNAIEYCVLHDENTNNVDVVQMAFESAYSYSIEEDIDEAYIFNDIFFVAAAGNGGNNDISYPAKYEHVFAVGATDMNDLKMTDSNYGWELDIAAPGENIVGIIPDSPLEPYESSTWWNVPTGLTSAASAMVSATVGLMLSVNPGLTNIDIENILHQSADQVNSNVYDYSNGYCYELGYGRLNTYEAVCMAWEAADVDEVIETNTTWDEPKMFRNDVIVKSGAKLTITSEVRFGPNGRLIIEAVPNLKLTEDC